MESAFWDTSAIVPLCVAQRGDVQVRNLAKAHKIVVWWGTSVEAISAFARLNRMQMMDSGQLQYAHARLVRLRQGWNEVQPTSQVRQSAENLLDRYELRAADSLQLAAAYVWSLQRPKGRLFISGDKKLSEAARLLGFQVIAVS